MKALGFLCECQARFEGQQGEVIIWIISYEWIWNSLKQPSMPWSLHSWRSEGPLMTRMNRTWDSSSGDVNLESDCQTTSESGLLLRPTSKGKPYRGWFAGWVLRRGTRYWDLAEGNGRHETCENTTVWRSPNFSRFLLCVSRFPVSRCDPARRALLALCA